MTKEKYLYSILISRQLQDLKLDCSRTQLLILFLLFNWWLEVIVGYTMVSTWPGMLSLPQGNQVILDVVSWILI